MFWKKYKEAIIILIFLALAVLAYFFVIRRLVVEIGNKRNKLQELLVTRENEQKRFGDLPKIKKDFELLSDSEKKIYPFLAKDKAVELIQDIEKLAENTGNEVAIEVVPSETSAKGKTKDAPETIMGALPAKDYIQLRIKVTGSFFSLLKLMNKLENSDYYLDIVSFQISRNQEPDKDKEKVAAPVTKNPFSQNPPEAGAEKEDSEEVISLVNVVIYTQK